MRAVPRWPEERCPKWCTADHIQQGDTEHGWHDSDLFTVPAVELRSHDDGAHFTFYTASCDLELGIEQRIGSRERFIHVSVDGERARTVRLSIESAARLMEGLTEVLQREAGEEA